MPGTAKNQWMNVSNRSIGRLLRNKGAMFGLIIIALAIFIALTAYFIAPDPSPDANRMIVEIGGRKPGFRQMFLCLKRSGTPQSISFLHRLIAGREDLYVYIPIDSYTQKGDSLIIGKYIDEGVTER